MEVFIVMNGHKIICVFSTEEEAKRYMKSDSRPLCAYPWTVSEGVAKNPTNHDAVNHPSHYTSHPSGVECIDITRHYCFAIGNAIKYLWRAGLKTDANRDARDKEIEDLQKAIWYINDRIAQLRQN